LEFSAIEGIAAPIVVMPPVPSVTASGSVFVKPPKVLFQRQPTDLKIQGFRKKLLTHLRDSGHVATEAICDAILACAVGAVAGGAARTKFLEEIVERFRKADVSHFLILPHKAIAKPLNFEGYSLGPTDGPALRSRCRRAQSDYADLYIKELEGCYSLKSPSFNHVVIDFLKPMMDRRLSENAVWRDLLLNYFTLVSRQHFEFMWAHLDRTQVLSRPFDAAILDVHRLRHDLGRLANKVTVYLEFSNLDAGYVVPERQTSTSIQIGPDSAAFAQYKAHHATYHLAEVGDSELGRTLHACASFCQQALRFLEAGRVDDAALYATICLEHLFSEKKSTCEAVSSRTAILTFLRLASSYSEAAREVSKLYDARSAFVHSGKPVTASQAERLIAYARETIRSMLFLHLKPENRSAGFLERWVKDLDFIVAGFDAGRTFDASFLADNGIFKL
jgi:hypothetical protein